MAQSAVNNNVTVVPLLFSLASEVVDSPASSPPTLTIPWDTQISKSAACKEYALDEDDLKDLGYEIDRWTDDKSNKPRRAHLYNERAVEALARAKYSDFDADKEYLEDVLAVVEEEVKRMGRGWVLEAMKGAARSLLGVSPIAEHLRIAAILAAPVSFVLKYPLRPTAISEELSQSESFVKLYALMAQSDEPSPGTTSTAKTPNLKKWGVAYTSKVYRALFKITQVHGPRGWEEARWVVYDQCVKHKREGVSLKHFKANNSIQSQWQWEDTAAFWLHVEDYKTGSLLKGQFLDLFPSQEA